MSIVLENTLADPSYAPYCMSCSTHARQRHVQPLHWRCGQCGAVTNLRDYLVVVPANGVIDQRETHEVIEAARAAQPERKVLAIGTEAACRDFVRRALNGKAVLKPKEALQRPVTLSPLPLPYVVFDEDMSDLRFADLTLVASSVRPDDAETGPVTVGLGERLADAVNGFKWRDPDVEMPPPLKVVVGWYGQAFFLVDVQSWGWEDALKGGKIGKPLLWCDTPPIHFR